MKVKELMEILQTAVDCGRAEDDVFILVEDANDPNGYHYRDVEDLQVSDG